MARYQLTLDVDITRRIGWSDEDLAVHIDEVFERLHQATGAVAVDCSADLDTGRAGMALRFDADADADDDGHAGRALIGVAIRSCGGEHRGLLPFAEEASLKPERNQWSGLRTPLWTVRSGATSEISIGG